MSFMESPMHLAICEDDGDDLALLLQRIEESGVPVQVDTFPCDETLLAAFLPGKYDLIFLDIYMGGAKGLDAAAAIRQRDEDVMLAFTTASLAHTLDGYRLNVLKYLEKPVTAQAVAEALSLAALKRRAQKTISLLIGGEMVEYVPNDILFFEMDSAVHAVRVHLRDKTLRASQKVRLEDVEKMVPKGQFLRCHRGYIVNLRWVRGMDGADFVMENGEKVYVRVRDRRKVKEAYENYMFSLTRKPAP